MESLLKWAILNGATLNEDAPGKTNTPIKPLDPEVIDAILGKPASVQMTECVDLVEKEDASLESKEIALDDLEMLVENIDNASNLEPLGLWPRVIALFGSEHSEVRIGALWVAGTALQHNNNAQTAFGRHGGLKAVLGVLEEDGASVGVRSKAVYCLSSYVRSNSIGLSEFVATKGLEVLKRVADSESAQVCQKVYFLLGALVDEALDEETPEDKRPGMSFVEAVGELGFVEVAAESLKATIGADDIQPAECTIGFLEALAKTDSGRNAIKGSQALINSVPEIKTKFKESPEINESLDRLGL